MLRVDLDWQEQGLTVQVDGPTVMATAHPSLSEHQVKRACDELGDLGAPVLTAWRSRMGITQAT